MRTARATRGLTLRSCRWRARPRSGWARGGVLAPALRLVFQNLVLEADARVLEASQARPPARPALAHIEQRSTAARAEAGQQLVHLSLAGSSP